MHNFEWSQLLHISFKSAHFQTPVRKKLSIQNF